MKKIGRPPVDKCNLSCPICGKEFLIHPYRLKKTSKICCSIACKHKLATLNATVMRKCIICGNEFSFLRHEIRNKSKPRVFCSHACMYKAKITNEISLYRKKAFRSLLHQCYFCKKANTNFQIHHIDENRTNNTLSNLVILCVSCHKKLHCLLKNPSVREETLSS
jgi:hypothetical protein